MTTRRRYRMGGSGFDPTAIPGLVAWWDCQAEAYSNDAVASTLSDLSGNSYHLTALGDPVFKTGVINAYPAVLFDNSNDEYHSTAAGLTSVASGTDTAFSIITVLSSTWSASNDTVWSFGRSSSGTPYMRLDFTTTRKPRVQKRGDGATLSATAFANGSNVPLVASVVHTGTATSLWKNGTAEATNPVSMDVEAMTVDRFSIGSMWLNGATGVDFYSGYIGEMVVYSRALPDSDRIQLQNYLGAKWGITIA